MSRFSHKCVQPYQHTPDSVQLCRSSLQQQGCYNSKTALRKCYLTLSCTSIHFESFGDPSSAILSAKSRREAYPATRIHIYSFPDGIAAIALSVATPLSPIFAVLIWVSLKSESINVGQNRFLNISIYVMLSQFTETSVTFAILSAPPVSTVK